MNGERRICATKRCGGVAMLPRTFCLECEFRRMRRTMDIVTAMENACIGLTAGQQDRLGADVVGFIVSTSRGMANG